MYLFSPAIGVASASNNIKPRGRDLSEIGFSHEEDPSLEDPPLIPLENPVSMRAHS